MPGRNAVVRGKSWNSLRGSQTTEEMDHEDDDLTHGRLSTVGEVRRALHPLQSQADRVGRQVEEFAETLDRLSSMRDSKIRDSSQALPLVEQFERTARETVKRLKRRHGDEQKEIFRQSRKRKLGHGSNVNALAICDEQDANEEQSSLTTVKDLFHWEQERQTWELVGLALQIQYPADLDVIPMGYKRMEQPRRRSIHRYSSEYEVYQNYLAKDNTAWERHIIVKWLTRVADESGEDVYDVVRDLDTESDRGSGLAAHGWLYSKEAIKQQKRLRSWPDPLDPRSPRIDAAMPEANKGKKALVTQLDPDAFSRQGRELQKEDVAFERATWMGCWELIRRGKSWEEIRDWCRERVENWRAISLRGHPRLSKSENCGTGDIRARLHWQQLCLLLARNGGVDDYERAIYGLFGGDEQSALKVCRTWDDHLYVYLNCQLVQRFSPYLCEQFHIPPSISATGLAKTSMHEFIQTLQSKPETSEEALMPFKMLQASIITGTFADFIHDQGARIAGALQRARYTPKSVFLPIEPLPVQQNKTSPLALEDYDMLRILSHMILIYQHIDRSLVHNLAADTIIAAYVDYLGKAGKQQLLTLYTSFLSDKKAAVALARQLPLIKDTTERQTILRLMKQYGMDPVLILSTQLDVIVAEAGQQKHIKHFPDLKILDMDTKSGDGPMLKSHFLGKQLQEWEEDLIDALEWFLLLDGNWDETFSAGSLAYKHFLKTESWTAARKLAKTVTFSRISRMKTRKLLGREVDLATSLAAQEDLEMYEDAMETDESEGDAMKQLRAQAQQDQLLASARTFRDMENFMLAMDALDQWTQVVEEGTEARTRAQEGNKLPLKEWKRVLQKVHDNVIATIEPLLQGWLAYPKDDLEAAEAAELRPRVLPELTLAYISVLSFGGTWLGRENLLHCLNLAQVIADNGEADAGGGGGGGDGSLCSAFVEAGRMAELVDTMAAVSRQVLAAEETTGGLKMKKRRGKGEVLDIWSVKAEVQG